MCRLLLTSLQEKRSISEEIVLFDKDQMKDWTRQEKEQVEKEQIPMTMEKAGIKVSGLSWSHRSSLIKYF